MVRWVLRGGGGGWKVEDCVWRGFFYGWRYSVILKNVGVNGGGGRGADGKAWSGGAGAGFVSAGR
jgi:hypothetical protein